MSIFKGHPKGLYGAALSNMGERFGFYVMMAILLLFLMAKFGFESTQATVIYSVFYILIYALSLVGGKIADKTKKYKQTILIGIIMMTIGYLIISIPTPTPVPNLPLYLGLTCFGLLVIAFGNGLFKGNLQAVVGQMYDNKEYEDKRDSGFQLFYMFINVGSFFSPIMAVLIRNWWVASKGFAYSPDLPALCHGHISGTLTPEATTRFAELANQVSVSVPFTDLTVFANAYLNVFTTGFHYAFGIAIFAMLISLTIYILNRAKFPDPAAKKVATGAKAAEIEMSIAEIKQRMYALFAIFGVVIFFWYSLNQSGVTLTLFAKDYVDLSAFSLDLFGGLVNLGGAELLQAFNPLFVVALTPIIIGFFGWLKARGKEPSTPKKIGIGMGITALAFVIMLIGAFSLPDKSEVAAMGGLPDAMRVTPFILIFTYLMITIGELFISPLGISFVSKISPPKYQGLMQGCWLSAAGVGNLLLIVGTTFYEKLPSWGIWAINTSVCLLAMLIMFIMLKWLERVAADSAK
jgi:POT family proton-dependent oligopeptide transporter